jgi:hypothetical protein
MIKDESFVIFDDEFGISNCRFPIIAHTCTLHAKSFEKKWAHFFSTIIRKFIDTWKFNRPWLRYDPKSKLMFCDICVSAQVVNSFTSGCSVMKKESVTKHESKKGKTKFLFLNCRQTI